MSTSPSVSATPAKLVAFSLFIALVAAAGALLMRWRKTPQGKAFVATH